MNRATRETGATNGTSAPRAVVPHTLSRSAGGGSEPPNLRPLCTRHDQAKTKGRWHLQANADGTLTWTSRRRRRYRTGPTDLHDP